MNPSRRALLAGFVALPVAVRLAPVVPAPTVRFVAGSGVTMSQEGDQFTFVTLGTSYMLDFTGGGPLKSVFDYDTKTWVAVAD